MDYPEPIPNPALITSLDAELPLAENWWTISSGLGAIEHTLPGPQIEWLRVAFEHAITTEIIRGPNGVEGLLANREAFTKIDDSVLIFWAAVATSTTFAPLRARLHHLLFLAKHGDVGAQARNAIEAYLEIARGSWSRLKRVRALEWALYLSKLIHQTSKTNEAVRALLALSDESLIQIQPEPGVALTALKILALHDPSISELPTLLERARNTYTDPFLTLDTVKIQQSLFKSDPERIKTLDREVVESYRAKASTSEGILKLTFLTDAAKYAQAHGLSDLYDKTVLEMQGLGFESLGLTKIQSEITIEGAELAALRMEMDKFVATIVEQPTLLQALSTLVQLSPPTGEVTRNMKTVEEIAQATPISALIPKTHIRPDGLASFTASTEDEKLDEALSEVEAMSMYGPFQVHTRALFEILGRFEPTIEELADLLIKEPHVSAATARTLAKALLHFQDGDYESAATNVAPKIETMGRALLAALGVPTYRVQQGQRRAGIQQLSPLLSDLKPWLDPSWHRFLQTFLVGKFAGNYRNDLLHGYLDEVHAVPSSFVLIAALHLALNEVVTKSETVAVSNE